MRKPEYLSPTSINTYYRSPEEFYINYLAENRPPRSPQTKEMAVGSAFDAYVKSYLHEMIFGKGVDPRYELRSLFETQVEIQNRDLAWNDGAIVFANYKKCGALTDLLFELKGAIGKPRFEFELRGMVTTLDSIKTNIEGVIILGKPDLFFLNKDGFPVILDWKVNGYYSQWGASPKKGFLKIFNDDNTIDDCHRDAMPLMYQGMMINAACYLEDIDEQWASQLAAYGWLCGEDVGTEFITCIDQIACKNSAMRVVQHRSRISGKFQLGYYERAKKLWDAIQSGHIFWDLSPLESQKKCLALEERAKMLKTMASSDDVNDKLFKEFSS